ncbi:MAG TPA: hypothetical protein VN622_14210 [Clostridia bacterium]|nr:hypothetical protein [Clostridia bacterium]
MNYSIKVTGLQEATGMLREAIHAGIVNGLHKTGERGVALVSANAPVASGVLANAITAEYSGVQGMMKATVFSQPPADVYAPPVETGTRPHFPPPSMLLPWVKQRFSPASEKEALSIAFAIAKTIAKRGTKGKFMFDRSHKQLQTEATGIFEREIATQLQTAGFGGRQ